MNPVIRLKWPKLGKWYLLPIYSLCVVSFFQGVIHLNPYNQEWMNDGSFSWGNFLQFLFIDQTLIECITVFIILWGIRLYSSGMGVKEVEISFKGLTRYFLQFIPLFLVIYICYAPLTTTLRFIYHSFIYADPGSYFEQYFFLNTKIFLVYLFPGFLTGFSILILGLVLGERVEEVAESKPVSDKLIIRSDEGESLLAIEDIVRAERKDRKTWITARNKELFVGNWTLIELEKLLPSDQFIRINRANLLRTSYIKTWSHWQNQKYILRSIDEEEFVVSRARMKQIKEALMYRIS